MLQTGIKGRIEWTVTPDRCAGAVGSGELDVFATPSMIALIEETAWKSVVPYLQPGEGTVGTALDVRHVAATPVGLRVTCETELTLVDRRRLVFIVRVYDPFGLVGEGKGRERLRRFSRKEGRVAARGGVFCRPERMVE